MAGAQIRMLSEAKSREEIIKFRKMHGLDQLKQGTRQCLKCDKTFKSIDVKGNKLCDPCSHLNSK